MRKKEKGSLWVRFLAAAEAAGTKLRNGPLFVREWIRRERSELARRE